LFLKLILLAKFPFRERHAKRSIAIYVPFSAISSICACAMI
jgi:hypothetical protein